MTANTELLEKPLPKPRRDLAAYASARTLEALLESLLALRFLEQGYTRNAASKAFQAWQALTATILALFQDEITKEPPEKEAKGVKEKALTRIPTTRLKALGQLIEKHIPYYAHLTSTALDLHDYQYHGPDPDTELSKYRSRIEAARDIAMLLDKLVELIERYVKPELEHRGRWSKEHEQALQELLREFKRRGQK
ncbi:PaREP1 family protein [Pyrofollis japonicus]|uniref:PaREP1 family protein n=1 Tax=Pyrofollis japonicus TaxID=3060460 RepID=UPI00295B1FBE|nr:PaREP1 family protein [Pyrofollis japonicus]BEP16704.1 PaREP1 family protein [Pyrofollis japonicus]